MELEGDGSTEIQRRQSAEADTKQAQVRAMLFALWVKPLAS